MSPLFFFLLLLLFFSPYLPLSLCLSNGDLWSPFVFQSFLCFKKNLEKQRAPRHKRLTIQKLCDIIPVNMKKTIANTAQKTIKQTKTPDQVHISVYTICKNEQQFVERFVTSIWADGKGADKLYILDTGSTDNTVIEFHRVLAVLGIPADWLIIQQKTYDQFRFDTSRNDNMDMIDEANTDALFCIDLDETVIPDFWPDVRKMVASHPNFDRIYYRYAWSHDSQTGDPTWVFWYDKLTKPYWRWRYPVHEALYQPEDHGYTGQYYLDPNKIYLHHYPDNTKSRSSYLPLLQLRAQEYPEDLYGLYYLAREYSFKGDYINALATATTLYVRLTEKNDDYSMMAPLCVMIGHFYELLGKKLDAEHFYKQAITTDAKYAEGYIRLAQLYAYTSQSAKAFETLDSMAHNAEKKEDWKGCPYVWRTWKRCQIEADALCWMGLDKQAYAVMQEALADIKTDDDRTNATRENFYEDYDFISNKLAKQA